MCLWIGLWLWSVQCKRVQRLTFQLQSRLLLNKSEASVTLERIFIRLDHVQLLQNS